MIILAAALFVIHQSAAADLPFLRARPIPVVTVQIDGIPARVTIDTWAPGLALSRDFVASHHLRTFVRGRGVFTGGRTAPILGVQVRSVRAGAGLRVENVDADVMPSGGPPGGAVDGALGTAFLAHFRTTIDYRRRRLLLAPPTPAVAIALAPSVPMRIFRKQFIFVTATVNGVPMRLALDTGGAGVGLQLTKAALAAARIDTKNAGERTFPGPAGPTRELTFTANVALAGLSREHLPGVFFPGCGRYGIFPLTVSGSLSSPFFEGHALTLDFVRMIATIQ